MRLVLAVTAAVCLSSFTDLYAQEARGVVYDFGATWCGPCQQVAPIVEKLQREGLPILKVDIDKQRDLADKFSVQQIPTFVLVIEGKEVDRTTGRMTESDLRRMVARIPQSSPQVASPVTQRPMGPMSIPVELGESAPLTRPAPMKTEPEQTRVAEKEEKRGLRDLISLGRSSNSGVPAVVRGNDSSISAADPVRSPAADAGAVPSNDPMNSSVRIRVITNGRIDLGSGTVISSKAGVSHILTCAHIFKEFTDDSRIEVDVFERGVHTPYTASLKKCDHVSDLGIISIPTTSVVPQVAVGGPKSAPRIGEAVAAIGCSGGDEPTRQQSRVTDIDKYEGPHNLLCTGVPVQGRSGGGLFNDRGEIVGVCSAADEDEQRGFYSGLLAIHKLLDECQMTALYAPPVKTEPVQPAESFAAAESFPERSVPAAAPREMAATPPAAPIAPAESGPVDVQAGEAEVVVIIRDRSNPASANRVVILHEASPKFMTYLSGELSEGQLNMDLLGASTAPAALPEVSRETRIQQVSATSTAGQLRPTALSQPVQPQKYVRSSSSR
ncbi:thioredoxin domain-containing protein [Planctomicrobium sp. SH661]|uniref:thioredoxin domain-containing protein n=1 Tax=Planctomicrobium sp. SH661 TaxID=3448124 RepID=UPI003F5B60D0